MSVTYTYVGNNYTSVTGLYSKSEHVIGYIEFASAIPPNQSKLSAFGTIPNVVSFSFSDGVDTISSANGGALDIGAFWTDGAGNIQLGNMDATITTSAGVNDIDIVDSAGDQGLNAVTSTQIGSQAISGKPGTWSTAGGGANLSVLDTTTSKTTTAVGSAYTGPVAGLQEQYVNITTDNLNITATSPNWFIHSGSGEDGINVSQAGGNNILDGGTGSNFLTGGAGNDTFYLDNRNPAAPIFSTVVNFHSGDNVTVWGVNATDFSLLKLDNQGAAGFTGLDLLFTAPGHTNTSFVLAGYSSADLTNGKLSLSYGTTPDLPGLPGSQYLLVHGN